MEQKSKYPLCNVYMAFKKFYIFLLPLLALFTILSYLYNMKIKITQDQFKEIFANHKQKKGAIFKMNYVTYLQLVKFLRQQIK
jgi:hypothetical protein